MKTQRPWPTPTQRDADRARLITPQGARLPLIGAVTVQDGVLIVDLTAHPALRQQGTILEFPKMGMMLVRSKRRTRALCTICPHKPRKGYRVRRQEGGEKPTFRCGAHGWKFDHKGKPSNQKAKRRLRRFTVQEDGDQLRVRLAPPAP